MEVSRWRPSWRRVAQVACLLLFCWLFLVVTWPYAATPVPGQEPPSHYADRLAAAEWLDAETFLRLDPLLALSTALAARMLHWSLALGAVVLLLALAVPRAFCAWICPLGTLIDGSDLLLGRWTRRHHLRHLGAWARLRFALLTALLVAALAGVLLSGFFAAIPLLSRGIQFCCAPWLPGLVGRQPPPFDAWQGLSIALFLAIFALSLLGPRLWCRLLCPTGALFSLANLLRVRERQVSQDCNACGRCERHCSFGALVGGKACSVVDCSFCRSCASHCPKGAVRFGSRQAAATLPLSRRGFLAGLVGGGAAAGGVLLMRPRQGEGESPVRPPGALPEEAFTAACIRCAACYQACPNGALQPLGFQRGLEGLWTPQLRPTHAGCDPSCNACGQVCPTGAIRPLALAEKRAVRLGLAEIDQDRCLPWAGVAVCERCAEVCRAAGHEAISFERVGVEVDEEGLPVEGSGFAAPVVERARCVGCGLCESRCHAFQVIEAGVLSRSAIVVVAGEGRDDRLRDGSYLALRAAEQQARAEAAAERERGRGDFY